MTSIGKALKSWKLSPKFIGPYQILKRVDSIAYQIVLPPNLHNVFHGSQLWKYVFDSSRAIEPDVVQLREQINLWYISVENWRQKD